MVADHNLCQYGCQGRQCCEDLKRNNECCDFNTVICLWVQVTSNQCQLFSKNVEKILPIPYCKSNIDFVNFQKLSRSRENFLGSVPIKYVSHLSPQYLQIFNLSSRMYFQCSWYCIDDEHILVLTLPTLPSKVTVLNFTKHHFWVFFKLNLQLLKL